MVFVGRDREFAVLRDVLDATANGAGRVALVEGEAGIGKTRLLAELAAAAEASGCAVFRGAAYELERDRPFGAVVDALALRRDASDPERAAIAALLGGSPAATRVPAGEQPELRFRISDEIVDLVERLSAGTPVLLLLEDLHWADPSTLLVVHQIVRRLADRPIFVLGSCRPLPHPHQIDSLAEAAAAAGAHIILGPLADDAVADLVSHATGARPGQSILTQVASAGGNPLFVTELLAALRDEGAIKIAKGIAEAPAASLPPSLRLTILRRLSFLPRDALDVLRLAAALGSSFSLSELALMSRLGAVELAPRLQDALQAGVIGEERDDRLRFRHDLIREAIYEDMPEAVRKGLHREAAHALASAGSAAVRVAEHVWLGAAPGDAEAIVWLRRAAQEESPRSPVVAVRLLERALDLIEPSQRDRTAIVAEMLEPLVWAGESLRAEQLAFEVLTPGVDPAVEFTIRRGLAGILAFRGQLTAAVDELERGASLDGAPARERARLAAAAASVRALLFGGEATGRSARAALDRGRQTGSRSAEAIALQALAVLAAADGRISEAVALAEQALAAAQRMGLEEGRWEPFLIPHFWLGVCLLNADRFDEAMEIAAAGRRVAKENGVIVPLVQWVSTGCQLWTGNWDDAIAEMETWLRFGEETGVGIGVAPAHAGLAFVAFHRNDLAEAEAAVARGERELVLQGAQGGIELVPWMRAHLLSARGDAATASAMLAGVWDALAPVRRVSIASTPMGPDLVRFACAANDADTARRVTEELEEFAGRSGAAGVLGAALLSRAMLERDPAIGLEAVAAYRSSPRSLETAFACEDVAALLPGADARDLLGEAVGIYERIGASRDLIRAEAALGSVGNPRRRSARHERVTVGWASLSETELKVVRLAKGGLTNREIGDHLFISPRTVETHLGHIFQKLGLSRRVELAVEATRHLG